MDPNAPTSTEPVPSSSRAGDYELSVPSSSAVLWSDAVDDDDDEYYAADPDFDLLCSQVPDSVARGETVMKGKGREE